MLSPLLSSQRTGHSTKAGGSPEGERKRVGTQKELGECLHLTLLYTSQRLRPSSRMVGHNTTRWVALMPTCTMITHRVQPLSSEGRRWADRAGFLKAGWYAGRQSPDSVGADDWTGAQDPKRSLSPASHRLATLDRCRDGRGPPAPALADVTPCLLTVALLSGNCMIWFLRVGWALHQS